MAEFDFRTALKIKPAEAPAEPASRAGRLSAAAEAVAAERPPAPPAPVGLAGAVRMIEFMLVIIVGLAIYACYLLPVDGFAGRYLVAVSAIAVLAMFAFQIADIYQVQAFRGLEKQYL